MKTIKLITGTRPRGIRAAPDGKSYVVTLESASKFVVLDDGDYHVIKTVDTRLGPYGVSYDPSGRRLFVAASRDSVIQVFDAGTYAPMHIWRTCRSASVAGISASRRTATSCSLRVGGPTLSMWWMRKAISPSGS